MMRVFVTGATGHESMQKGDWQSIDPRNQPPGPRDVSIVLGAEL